MSLGNAGKRCMKRTMVTKGAMAGRWRVGNSLVCMLGLLAVPNGPTVMAITHRVSTAIVHIQTRHCATLCRKSGLCQGPSRLASEYCCLQSAAESRRRIADFCGKSRSSRGGNGGSSGSGSGAQQRAHLTCCTLT